MNAEFADTILKYTVLKIKYHSKNLEWLADEFCFIIKVKVTRYYFLIKFFKVKREGNYKKKFMPSASLQCWCHLIQKQ